IYPGGVFYAKDAFEGLALVQQLVDPAKKAALLADLPAAVAEAEGKQARRDELRAETRAAKAAAGATGPGVEVLATIPAPPFLGVKRLEPAEIPVREVYECFDLKSLFRLSWGVSAEREAEFRPVLERLKEEAIERRLLVPRVAYGYFRCHREGDTLVVADPEATSGGRRFAFPRQEAGERLCLADYFRPAEAGGDVVAFTVVTAGPVATEEGERLNKAGRYTDAYSLHGFATQFAEALAEWLHRRIRRELGIGERQGQRFSFGYPACPDLADQAQLCRLLGAESIGVTLTPAFQLVPEQSTSALVAHHPAAKYFSAR
ncbi:MAG TPA: vitamin B12 dependent-methionine synthase activation domain-containing protein, partial [Planctomycetota bacterium]|nr:vitamin B12 dependent-methionine synthase activation domain-containing protein [Planctomycetota bacterium]